MWNARRPHRRHNYLVSAIDYIGRQEGKEKYSVRLVMALAKGRCSLRHCEPLREDVGKERWLRLVMAAERLQIGMSTGPGAVTARAKIFSPRKFAAFWQLS